MLEQLLQEAGQHGKSKQLADTFLYRVYPDYKTHLFSFVMKCDRIDTTSEAFADIMYDVKRRNVSNALPKVLTSSNVVLGIFEDGKSFPKCFKVFVHDDVRSAAKTPKVFINVSDCIYMKDGVYVCNHIEWIIDYLVSAMSAFIYELAPERIIGNQVIIKDGAQAFCRLFSYILDRIYKTTTLYGIRKRVEFVAALYYQVNLLGRDFNDPRQYDTMVVVAMRAAGIDKVEAQAVTNLMPDDAFDNLDVFLKNVGTAFMLSKMSTSRFLDFWMGSFGTGTIFATEYFPAFSSMLTDTYLGGFINQQLTIEKVAGQSMVTFTKKVIEIGAGVV